MLIVVICLSMENNFLSLKLTMKMLTLQLNFVSKAYLMDLVLTESGEVSLNENVYNFLVYYNSINKFYILTIQKYLMIKNSI